MHYTGSNIKKKQSHNKAWLITFSDLITLLLVFFVMLFSMSTLKKEAWQEVISPLSKKEKILTKTREARPNAVFNAAQNKDDDFSYALDYLYKVLSYKIKEIDGLDGIEITQEDRRLVLSFSSDLLFRSNSTKLVPLGKTQLSHFVQILSALPNQIHIIAYSDPRKIMHGPYLSNWDLSLARALEVAAILRKMGYPKEFVIFGGGDKLYQELPDSLARQERLRLSRAVKIIIFDEGYFGDALYF